ncbi:unnamed protein product [Rotaria magnacalcarata]|nr:unnamed protein product [Rotaria magnacalcarata]CAF4938285.1 unnamed protein product [Rotaria magnacalcarata]
MDEAVFIPKDSMGEVNVYTENVSDCIYWHIKGEYGDMFAHFSIKSDKDKLKKLIEKNFSGQNIEIETFGGIPNGRIIPRKKDFANNTDWGDRLKHKEDKASEIRVGYNIDGDDTLNLFSPLIEYIYDQNDWKFDIPQSIFNQVERNLSKFKIDKNTEQFTVPNKWSGQSFTINNTAGFANQSKIQKSIPETVTVSSNKHFYTKPSINLHTKYIDGQAVFNPISDCNLKKISSNGKFEKENILRSPNKDRIL